MASIYELARQRIAQRCPIAALHVETAKRRNRKKCPSDSPERVKERNDRYYSLNRPKALLHAKAMQEEFRAKWGFYPSSWYYWKAKIVRGEITAGQLPKKYIGVFKEWKRKKSWSRK